MGFFYIVPEPHPSALSKRDLVIADNSPESELGEPNTIMSCANPGILISSVGNNF